MGTYRVDIRAFGYMDVEAESQLAAETLADEMLSLPEVLEEAVSWTDIELGDELPREI